MFISEAQDDRGPSLSIILSVSKYFAVYLSLWFFFYLKVIQLI